MCKKKINYPPLKPPKAEPMDVQAFKQELRIKLWNMIARNNKEVLTDPLTEIMQNSMPYLSQKQAGDKPVTVAKSDDVKSLDEIMPLPDKKAKPKPKAAKDLLVPQTSSEGEQMTVDDAISEADGNPPRKPATQQDPVKADPKLEPATDNKEQEAKQDLPSKRTLKEIWKDHLEKRRERADRKDYFAALDLQIYNKNAACIELLNWLDELDKQ